MAEVQKLLIEIRDTVCKLLAVISTTEKLYSDMHVVRDALIAIGDEIATLAAKIEEEEKKQ